VVEDVLLGVHIPLDCMNLVGSMWAILGHDDGTFELSVHEIFIVTNSSIRD